MLTLFAAPKPFEGTIGRIQRNALASWRQLGDDVQIVLVGAAAGTEAAAGDYRAEHRAEVRCTPSGAPLLPDVLAAVDARARFRLRCLVNADIVLLDDFRRAVETLAE